MWGRCTVSMGQYTYFLRDPSTLTRSCASSPDNSLSDKSFLMLSHHLRFGLPLPPPAPSLSCPHTLHLFLIHATFLQFLGYSPPFTVLLLSSSSFKSSLVTPLIHLCTSFLPHPTSSSHVLSSLPMSRHRTKLLTYNEPSCILPLESQVHQIVKDMHLNPDVAVLMLADYERS